MAGQDKALPGAGDLVMLGAPEAPVALGACQQSRHRPETVDGVWSVVNLAVGVKESQHKVGQHRLGFLLAQRVLL